MKQNFYFLFPEIKKILKENPKDPQLEQNLSNSILLLFVEVDEVAFKK
jgi:hypothetical protein